MKTACQRTALVSGLISLIILSGFNIACSKKAHDELGQGVPDIQMDLELFNAGFFTIQKPVGWEVYIAGHCSTLAFLIQDPENPLRRCFMFSEVGPFYMSEMQTAIDLQYMNSGGYPVAWIEMPVVDPLTPENFLVNFTAVADTQIARQFMPMVPRLNNLQLISSSPQSSAYQGAQTSLMRAIYEEQGLVAEGLFLVSVAPFMPFMNGPGGGNAYALSFVGISAPRGEFQAVQDELLTCIGSFDLSQQYVQNCMQQQADAWRGVAKAGETLRETSDIIMNGWERRNRTDDIIAEKRSDAILDKERLYDPDSGQVYEFDNGFYDTYDIKREQYKLPNLQPMPDDNYNLWMSPTMDGYRALSD